MGCTSLFRVRTGASPSQRMGDPLSLLLPTTLAPPTVSAPTGSDLLLSPPGLSATVSLLLLPMVLLAMALSEECSTDTLATMELPSSMLLSPVEKTKGQCIK